MSWDFFGLLDQSDREEESRILAENLAKKREERRLRHKAMGINMEEEPSPRKAKEESEKPEKKEASLTDVAKSVITGGSESADMSPRETKGDWWSDETAGVDIVGYSGNETNRTISHSLSAAPHLMIIKNRDSSFQWVVYHHKNTSAPETDYLYLSSNAATADFAGHFNDTAPTSSVFTVGTDTGVNKNSQNHIAYLWSEKQGFSKFSSFRGNSNSDGVFVMCGFRPSMVWIKRTEGSNHWFIWDKHRDGFNESNEYLKADASEAESDGVNRINILSNGFKITTSNDGVNAEEEYIFMAWADAPFVNSNGVPCNAR